MATEHIEPSERGHVRDVVVITGGARGIGFSCARRFADNGSRIAIWDLDAEAGVARLALEDLTADPDRQIRRLVTEICGLPWDPSALRFWETRRALRTASATQVRRPIIRSDHGGWRRYEGRLGLLLEALAPYRVMKT